MKDRIVGTYNLGSESIVLELREGTGGGFMTRAEKEDRRDFALLWVGADENCWQHLVSALLHEAKEFCDMRLGCRYGPSLDYSKDSGDYLFVETHVQHSEVCGRLAWFLADCLPDLADAWKRWRKPVKKGKGKP